MACGYADPTRMERSAGAADCIDRRNGVGVRNSGSSIRSDSIASGLLDQCFAGRTLGCVAGRMVDSVVDCAERERGDCWRDSESLQPTRGDCRANCDRIYRCGNEKLFMGVYCGGGFFGPRNRGIYFSVGEYGADCGAGRSAWLVNGSIFL